MVGLIGYCYVGWGPWGEKGLAIDLGLGLMRAVTKLAERDARLPAGPSNPNCNAGMSFSALRDAAPLPRGPAARRFFIARLTELAEAASIWSDAGDARMTAASRMLGDVVTRGTRGFDDASSALPAAVPAASAN